MEQNANYQSKGGGGGGLRCGRERLAETGRCLQNPWSKYCFSALPVSSCPAYVWLSGFSFLLHFHSQVFSSLSTSIHFVLCILHWFLYFITEVNLHTRIGLDYRDFLLPVAKIPSLPGQCFPVELQWKNSNKERECCDFHFGRHPLDLITLDS